MSVDAGHPPRIRGGRVDPQPRASAMMLGNDTCPLPADLDHLRATLERSLAVGRELVGLRVEDARELASRSHRHVRVVPSSGPGSTVTLELDSHRINVRTEDDIVVDFWTG
jgi:hypothetical protein